MQPHDNSSDARLPTDDPFAYVADQTQRYLNRALSGVAFNQRVLSEAMHSVNPLFERLRFLSIAATNQEEFFMVRGAQLRRQALADSSVSHNGDLTPRQQFEKINLVTRMLAEDMQTAWREIKAELVQHNTHIVKPDELSAEEAIWVSDTFANEIFPVLTPIAVDPSHPFPFIHNKGIAVVLMLSNEKTGEDSEALIVLPASLRRFVRLPGQQMKYVALEDLIIAYVAKIFPPPLRVKDHAVFRVLRASDIKIDPDADDAEEMIETFKTALKQRRRGDVIRLTVTSTITQKLLKFLQAQLRVNDDDIVYFGDLVGLADIREIITTDRRDLLFKTFNPRFPERVREFEGDCFAAIRHKDFVVHHPYESFDVVVQFLKQAAQDPHVISVKQTIYRTSHDSPIIQALIEAAEKGKAVTAVVELKARFDEEANVRWAHDMERAGIHVIFGFLKLKTHAKVSLITRREGKKVVSYAHLGTGNYHPETARTYTDLSYFTCDTEICHDIAQLFNYMTSYVEPNALSQLVIAPLHMRQTLMSLIDEEIKRAQAGKKAQIWIKCNAVTDLDIIDKLYAASQAGVEIDMIVRGMCVLRPGVPGLSENIHIKSIVGRYLEHSRIYCFSNGEDLPSPKAKIFMSSADLMRRNLDRRIETFVPIVNPTVHRQILNQIMIASLKDQANSWILHADGNYTRAAPDRGGFNAHEYFMNNPSLSGRGRALEVAAAPPHLQLDKTRRKN